MMMDAVSQPTGHAVEEGGIPLVPGAAGSGIYQDAAVWVFIAAFIGLAICWSTGWTSPWLGALLGGGIAYVGGAIVIAALGLA
jgi:hypothetical protein